MKNILDIIQGINPSTNVAAIEHILTKYSDENITHIINVLDAEYNQSYFKKNHFQKTLCEKNLFNYQLSTDVAKILGMVYPMYQFDLKTDHLFSYNINQCTKAKEELNEHGYHVLNKRLDEAFCDRIIEKLSNINFTLKRSAKFINGYNSNNIYKIKGNTSWVYNQQDILNIPEVQQLIANPIILQIIQSYMQCIPIHDQTNAWWSINYRDNNKELSRSAQQYHQDKGFIKFAKVFIYLNDVDTTNGAHYYVAGSARDYQNKISQKIKFSDRLSDSRISKNYPKERILAMEGEKGTVIIEDTSGFHKGSPVDQGHRLLLQLEYCCSLYFNPVYSFSYRGLTDNFVNFSKEYPRIFLNYNNQRYLSDLKRLRNNKLKLQFKNYLIDIKNSVINQ